MDKKVTLMHISEHFKSPCILLHTPQQQWYLWQIYSSHTEFVNSWVILVVGETQEAHTGYDEPLELNLFSHSTSDHSSATGAGTQNLKEAPVSPIFITSLEPLSSLLQNSAPQN